MNRHITRFSELRPPNMKNSPNEIDVLSVQAKGLAHPHPGHLQKTKKSCIGEGAQSPGRVELLGLAKEPIDLLITVNVRRLTPVTMREKVRSGNLRARVNSTEPDGEAPDHTQTVSPPKRLGFCGLGGPAKRQFRGDVRHALGLEKYNKVP
jgi:hypothetical protein